MQQTRGADLGWVQRVTILGGRDAGGAVSIGGADQCIVMRRRDNAERRLRRHDCDCVAQGVAHPRHTDRVGLGHLQPVHDSSGVAGQALLDQVHVPMSLSLSLFLTETMGQ